MTRENFGRLVLRRMMDYLRARDGPPAGRSSPVLKGPVILVANHASHMDTPVILAALPWRLRKTTAVAAAADYFTTTASSPRPCRSSSTPCRSNVAGRMGMNGRGHLDKLLDQGWNLLLFPEGTRSRAGAPGRVRRGAAVLAAAHNLSIVPIRVTGSAAMPPGRCGPSACTARSSRAAIAINVSFGEPIRPVGGTTALIERVQTSSTTATAAPRPRRTPREARRHLHRLTNIGGRRPSAPNLLQLAPAGLVGRQREDHLSDGARMVVDRACLAGRWGIAGEAPVEHGRQADFKRRVRERMATRASPTGGRAQLLAQAGNASCT